MDRLAQTIDTLGRLVAFPTLSRDSNLEMVDFLAEALRRAGARCEMQPSDCGTKANLLASFGPEAPGGILLSGHTDVVPVDDQIWHSEPFEMTRDGGRLFGRGTCDMKGFLAACLTMAPVFGTARLTQPLRLAFTHDEETGCVGGARLARLLADRGLTPAMCIVGEPTSMTLVDGHKGCHEYTVRLTGHEGHGSAPDLGVNAAEFASRYVARLLTLREDLKVRAPADSPFDPPWTTLNIGRIAGGTVHNVIPGQAEVLWEMRPVQNGDAAFVLDAIDAHAEALSAEMRARHPGAGIARETIGEVRGLVRTRANRARDLVARLTGANGSSVVAFGTEAGLFQEIGTDTIICGPGDIAQAHKPDEYIEISQLSACLDLLQALADHLAH